MITIYVGIPGSGKSTAAVAAAAADRSVVVSNRDSLRAELFGHDYSHGAPEPVREETVTEVQLTRAREALAAGRNIIVDDTNLDPAVRRLWRALAEDYATCVTERYFDVPLAVALARNRARTRRVPDQVIAALHAAATDPDGRLTRS